jgi:hypothetical protein
MKSLVKLAALALLIPGQLFVSCKKDDLSTRNHPPIADAGEDMIIEQPANSTFLNGGKSRDEDHNLARYQWTKISGPDGGDIINPDKPYPRVENLTLGTYEFELQVSDKFGRASKDIVQVTVVLSRGATFDNLSWANDANSQMITTESPDLSSELQTRVIRKVFLVDNSSGDWFEIEKDGTGDDQFYYKIENNKIIAYMHYVTFDPANIDLSSQMKIEYE